VLKTSHAQRIDRQSHGNSIAQATVLEVVSVPFDEIKPAYDYVGKTLKLHGFEPGYERIKQARPNIAEMSR
jgi:hypothetical protein